MGLYIGNFFIDAFTLMLGHPFAQQRWLRFFCQHLEVVGTPDLESIRPAEGEVLSYGEGLAEGFDIGGI